MSGQEPFIASGGTRWRGRINSSRSHCWIGPSEREFRVQRKSNLLGEKNEGINSIRFTMWVIEGSAGSPSVKFWRKNVLSKETCTGLGNLRNLILLQPPFFDSELRVGFHWPPFISVSHLHLHLIYPASTISGLPKYIGEFHPRAWWFRYVHLTKDGRG